MKRPLSTLLLLPVFSVALCGCGSVFLGLGDVFDALAGTFGTVGTCLSELDLLELNGVFAHAAAVEWDGDQLELTDAAQGAVADFYAEALPDVAPRWYLNERFYQFSGLGAGDLLEVEFLSDLVESIYVYDADFVLLAASVRNHEDFQTTLDIPIFAESATYYVQINLAFLSDDGAAIVRLTRHVDVGVPPPVGQTVVLNFAGAEGVTFRTGYLVATDVTPLDDPDVRDAAVASFKESFADFNLTVLTDSDAEPTDPYSVIHIGYASPSLGEILGRAEYVDWGNRTRDDIAVVDLDSQVLRLAHVLSARSYGLAVGKVAAHEMGHLLGLYHVYDADALMTIGCKDVGLNVGRVLSRRLKKAPHMVDFTVAGKDPVLGYQDPTTYLTHILGAAE